ncbi:MAG TPA: DUF1592 domain-containing protein [Polyangiaceae bacterium]|nr:DUF1592 domain-containing protein [Polyangiaceae bacterium]
MKLERANTPARWRAARAFAPALVLVVACSAKVTAPGGSGAATGGAGGTSNGDAPAARTVSMEGSPIYSRFLRLTNSQWENSVRDILHLPGRTGASENFQHAVGGTTDFDNNERVVFVDNQAWSDFEHAAEAVADQVTATDAALQAVGAGSDATTFLRTFGRRAFRRDLTPAEMTAYQAIYSQGSQLASGTQSAFTRGARYVISTMLQSPHFLYRIEQADDGAALGGYEMAAKLSLWIRDTTPADAMLDAAVAGQFDTADGAAAQAQAMLDDPAAVAMMRLFNGALFKLALYDSIAKTGVDGYSDSLNPEFKEASFLFFDRIYSQGLGVRDLYTSTVGFAGPGLAKLYGVSVSGSGIQAVDLPGRAGYYAQAPFLALWARNATPDSIHRGVRINLDTLCADPGVPSAMLPPIPDPMENQTNRQVVTGLTRGCGADCHGHIINPIGFAFENFDGLGRERALDNGQPIDTSGEYPFAEGLAPFAGASELMELIAGGSQAHECWAKKMTSYALERDLVETDRPTIEALGAVSRQPGASLKQVMIALVKQDAFRLHAGGTP